MEMELKLLIGADAHGVIARHPLFAAVEARTQKAITTYYDTPELDLFRLGATFRVRGSDGDFIQTVKLERPDEGIGTRVEWEWTLGTPDPDPGKLASLPEEAGPVPRFAKRLAPIFATEIERTIWPLELAGGTVIEAVIDRGALRAGTKTLDVSELELELKAGSAAAVFRLAIDLTERVQLRYEPRSKAARGYALAVERLPTGCAGTASPLGSGLPISAVFPRLVNGALRELAAEMPAAAEGDIEGVHRMRAAIRKLRSMLVLFDPYLDRHAAREFNTGLRTLGQGLGQGRDWDVFLTETLPRVEAIAQGAGAALLRGPAELRRAEAHAAIADILRGHLPTGLILGVGAWTADLHWLRRSDAGTPLVALIPDLLDRLERKARKRAKDLDVDDPEQLHALRKSLKKLRYSVESVASLFASDPVHDYLHAIKSVLATLGDINDAVVAGARVRDIVSSEAPDLAPAAAVLLGHTGKRGAKACAKLPKTLRGFHKLGSFWPRHRSA